MSEVAPSIRSLLLTRSLWGALEAQCEATDLETGGKALGRCFSDGTLLACLPVGPGPQAHATRDRFAPDVDHQQEAINAAILQWPRLRLILDWHLHPDGPPALSVRDLEAARRLLEPATTGLQTLIFLVLTPKTGGLEPHAFCASQADGLELAIHAIPTAVIEDADPRARWLLEPLPPTLRVVMPLELADELEARLCRPGDAKAPPPDRIELADELEGTPCVTEGIPLYGRLRLNEALLQIFAAGPWLDADPIGRALRAGDPPLE